MRIPGAWLVAVLLAVLAACGGDDSGDRPIDAASQVPDGPRPSCGAPGDVGNDQGVGLYCMSDTDCARTVAAHECSATQNRKTHFCTLSCDGPGMDAPCGLAGVCGCNAANQCRCKSPACDID